jgi:sulfite reductase alpha subunit-like flavoprotein
MDNLYNDKKTFNKMNICIFYGSEKGYSKDIAKHLSFRCSEELQRKQIIIHCKSLNSFTNEINDFEKKLKIVIIICSTTGNGEPPHNADKFLRFLLRNNNSVDIFNNVNYTVFGLGNSNYDQFCYMGKTIDKRIRELGGIPFQSLSCHDEEIDDDDNVDEWLENIIIYLKDILL